MRYKLIKPPWAKPYIKKNEPNPDFITEVSGPNVIEKDDLSPKFLKKKNQEGYSVYFFPNYNSKPTKNKFANGNDIDTFQYVFADMDLKDEIYTSKKEFLKKLLSFPLRPRFVVDSGHGVHAYWKVKDLDRDSFMELQFRLIEHFQTDDSVWTPCQVMRAPGYYNTKDYYKWVQCETLPKIRSNKVYSVSTLRKHLPPLSAEAQRKIEDHKATLRGEKKASIPIEDEEPTELPKKFEELMEKNKTIRKLFQEPKEIRDDRSGADFELASRLFEQDFDRKEAFRVIFNTEKAKSRQYKHRYEYAAQTVDKAYQNNSNSMYAPSAQELIKNPPSQKKGDPIYGPRFMDCNYDPWRKKQVLGLVGGTGIGKTSISLKIIQEFIKNNPDSDDIFFYFNIEQETSEVFDRWRKLVGDDPECLSRLRLIGADYFSSGSESISPNLQNIHQIVKDTCKILGKPAGVVTIDHIDAVHGNIDLDREPTFGMETSDNVTRRDSKSIVLNKAGIVEAIKRFTQDLNAFTIIFSQTSRENAQEGDVPLGLGSAFGTSGFEQWIDYVVTLWRPLNRVMTECKARDLFVTAFQYVKNRHAKPNRDKLLVGSKRTIKFIPDREDFVQPSEDDMEVFQELLSKAIEKRKIDQEYKSTAYSKAPFSREKFKLGSDEEAS